MKKGKLSALEESRVRLLEAWEGEVRFGRPVGCVATTYTFDAGFFEEECLGRFVGMEHDANEDGRTYLLEREERFSEVMAAVLVDGAHVDKQRSLRWHLLTVRVPGGGVMHAKVALLVWEKHVRILISSANLTEPAYRSNWENQVVLDFSPEAADKILLNDVVQFLRGLVEMAVRGKPSEGPAANIFRLLRQVEKQTRDWADESKPRGEAIAAFVGVQPAEPSLFKKLEGRLGGPASQAWVVSPFFDEGEAALKTVAAMAHLLKQKGERSLTLVSPGRTLADGTVEIDLPKELGGTSQSGIDIRHRIVADQHQGEARRLHCKIQVYCRDDKRLYLFGSSNFTQAGTGMRDRFTNVEANVAYVVPTTDSRFTSLCEHAFPPFEEVDLDKAKFLDQARDSAEGEARYILPDAFGQAIFHGGQAAPYLSLEIVGEPPVGFRIEGPEGEALLDFGAWDAGGRSERYEVTWTAARPPTFVQVIWTVQGCLLQAVWPVNVHDTSELPPPDELRSLRLEELIEVLTSSDRMYQTVARLLLRRNKQQMLDEVETDPHKRVDTRNYLLRRVKRFSQALEGLRERLQRPAYAVESLRWRLFGPLGATELARRTAAEQGEGAAFMIVEIAQVVAEANLSAQAELTAADIRVERQRALGELATLARQLGAPENLRRYVNDVLEEILV